MNKIISLYCNENIFANISNIFPIFLVLLTVCDQLENGVAAVFGAPSPDGALSIRAVCNTFEVPYIATQEDGRPTDELTTINLYPNDMYISLAIKDLVTHYGWKDVTIIYEDEDGKF